MKCERCRPFSNLICPVSPFNQSKPMEGGDEGYEKIEDAEIPYDAGGDLEFRESDIVDAEDEVWLPAAKHLVGKRKGLHLLC